MKTEKRLISENSAKFKNFGSSLNLEFDEIFKNDKLKKNSFKKEIFEDDFFKQNFEKKNKKFLSRKFFLGDNYKPFISSHKKFYVKGSDDLIKNFNKN